MPSLFISRAVRKTNGKHRFSWVFCFCCFFPLAFAPPPTIPAMIFLCAVLLYCALFPIRPYRALTWNFVPWVIVLFGLVSVIWSEQPMQSLRAAPQIAISVLAALMFAQGLQARSFVAITLYAFIASNVVHYFVSGVFGSMHMVGQTL